MSRYIRALPFVVAALIAVFAIPGAVFAHEHRDVGNYVFVVGFINEPAFEGEQNGVSVRITTKDGNKPVAGLGETLKAQVIHGADERELTLRQAWGETWGNPGEYRANFYPTADGDYTFRFVGTIEGNQIDEKFTSSPEGFDSVKAVADYQFPVKVTDAGTMSQELAAARSAARTATILGGAGLATGIAGLVTAGLALRRRETETRTGERAVASSAR